MAGERTTAGSPPAGEAVQSLSFGRRGRRLYVLPTRFGILFMFVLAGMLAGSANYNNNLGFLLAFLLAAMTLVSVVHTHGNLKGLRVVSARARPAFAGGSVTFEICVRIDQGVRPALSFQPAEGAPTTRDLSPGDNRLQVMVPAAHRGLLKAGSLRIETHFPLGLFRCWTVFHLDEACVVYPAPIPGAVEFAFGTSGDGDGRAEGGPGVDDFRELRAYQAGDPLQRIAWKQSSRGQGLLTKEFQGEVGMSVVLDWDSLGPGDTEYKLSRLCSMVLRADSMGLNYGLKLPGLELEPGRGGVHAGACLKALALFGLPGAETA